MIVYSRNNNDFRKEKFQLQTNIIKQNGEVIVIKKANNKKSKKFLSAFLKTYQKMSDIKNLKFSLVRPIQNIDSEIKFSFLINYKSLDKILGEQLLKNDIKLVTVIIRGYINLVKSIGITKKGVSNAFKKIFGNVSGEYECINFGIVDLTFDNFFCNSKKDEYKLIDYEWFFNFKIPYKYVVFRSILIHYTSHSEYNLKNILSFKELCSIANISTVEMKKFLKMEYNFQKYVGQSDINEISVEEYISKYINLENQSNIINYIVYNVEARQELLQKQQEFLQNQQVIQQKQQELQRQYQNLEQKEYIIHQKEHQIKQMQSSKFWKTRNIYIHYKNGLRQGIKHPGLFLVFAKKRIIKLFNKFNLTTLETNKVKFCRKNKTYYYDIINYSIIDWDFRFQRPQQLSKDLSKQNKIYYISPNIISTNRDDLDYEDIKQMIIINKKIENVYSIQLVSYNKINIYKNILDNEIDKKYLKWSLQALKEQFNFEKVISIIELPFWSDVAKMVKETILVYDCMDDHEGFGDADKNVLKQERGLMKDADMVIVTSNALQKRVSKLNSNVIVAKNAVDLEHFIKLRKNNLLSDIRRPIIGYYGAISTWFDLDIIEYCAKKYKEYNFVLIGNVCDDLDVNYLQQMSNVHFLGEKEYKDIPKYLYYFDVCLIPFKIMPLTIATNPVKFFEYIASGKPVVSVNLPELEEYKDICYLSDNKKKFANNIKLALQENDEVIKDKRIKIAKENTWEKKANIIFKAINKNFFPKISIIIVTYNNLNYTKQCLASVFKHTHYPNYELIIVDNNSSDNTQEYLKKIEKENINVKIILNKKNRGFSGGNNDGLKIASGKYFVLLNNDTLVTNNWLSDLKYIIDSDEKLGIIGPISNSVGNIQQIDAGYSNIEDMNEWVKKYTSKNEMGYFDMQMLGFFCVMMKASVWDEVGPLDENYGIGMFEDDDYCEQVKKAGYKLGYTKNVFIHHFGSVSFKKIQDEKYKKIFNENRKYFEEKWNKKWVANLDGKKSLNKFYGC